MSALTVVTQQSQAALIPVGEVERMARAIAVSGLFGVKTPDQALALMLVAQAEGLHPATAARDYHIISGRPSMKADAMLARFQAAGGVVRWLENTDTRCAAEFSHPSSPNPVMIDWDLERARKAELMGNAMWKKYPRAMLRSRVASEGIRTVYPGVLCGMYTPEEVESFHHDPPPPREEIDITPPPATTIPLSPVPRITAAELAELEDAIRALNLDRAKVLTWAIAASKNAITEFHELTPLMLEQLSAKLPAMAKSPTMIKTTPEPEQEAA